MTQKHLRKTAFTLLLALLLLLTGCTSIVDLDVPAASPEATASPAITAAPEATAALETSPTAEPVEAPSPALTEVSSAIETDDASAAGDELSISLIPSDLPVIEVSTVDELLDAIGSDRVIRLADGEYNLTEAASYGHTAESDFWFWDDGFDGFQLTIRNVSNLYLAGNETGACRIVTEPRYATVLNYSLAENIGIQSLTIGHTDGQAYCTGGVLGFETCRNVLVDNCDLFGCGTIGITASGCRSVTASRTVIRECTYGGIEASSCRDFIFSGGKIVNCGISKDPDNQDDWTGFNLIRSDSCSNFALVNSEISGNVVETLFASYATSGYQILGCDIRDNTIGGVYQMGSAFFVRGKPITVSGSSFTGNTLSVPFVTTEGLAANNPILDGNGNPLDQNSMEIMPLVMLQPDQVRELFARSSHNSSSGDDLSGGFDEWNEVYVTTADEFLDAIASHTVIHIDAELIDFSTASNYGIDGGDYYYWANTYDGPCLVITGVDGLSIIGRGKDDTVLQTAPRYADVLYFDSCRNITISDLTAGHDKNIPGECSGDVLEFMFCDGVTIQNCGLFGCGVTAVSAQQCSAFSISDTEMYECSWLAVLLYSCTDFDFEHCSIHDCGSNSVHITDGESIVWDGEYLNNGSNLL